MAQDDKPAVDRRRFLKYAGTAAATAGIAGCSGGDGGGDGDDGGDGTDTTTDGGGMDSTTTEDGGMELETRNDYLHAANQIAHDEAPWIFLNRQFSVYGKHDRVGWEARVDERIDASAVSIESGSSNVTITQGNMDSGLDPHDHRETPTDNIVLHAYEGLLSRDRTGKVVSQLATGYKRVDPGLVRFTLRSNVSFHSGDSFTKEDAAFSVNRIVKSNVGDLESPQSDQLAGVTGAGVVDDANAIEVMSDGINPIVFAEFASYCDVMNKSWVESNGSGYINTHMDGTGPFQLKNYEQDVEVVFERFSEYWGDQPEIEELTWNAATESSTRVNQLLNGETEITVNVPPQEVNRVQNSNNASIAAVASTRIIYNGLRYDVEPFSEPEFRRALNYAVDLDSIVQNVLQTFGAPTGQPTLEGFTGYNENIDPYPYDPDEAESLVESSGQAGAEITLHTPVGRYLKDVEIAQAVAQQIDQLSNVSASVRQRDFGTLAGELTTGNIEDMPHWYLIGWGNSTFDASQTIIPLLTTDGALSAYSNETLDSYMEESQNLPGDASSGN